MSSQLIPKVFHRIWIGNKPMPADFVKYGETWLKYHPDWEMMLWTDENIPKLINQGCYDNVKQMAQKTDIARYEIVYKYGGVYLDCDFECFKSIEPLLDGVEAFSAGEMPGIISIGIMGCVPGNHVFKHLIDGIPASIERYKNMPINHQTGPFYFTERVEWNNEMRKQIVVFGPELFYPYSALQKHRKDEKFPNAYAVHHWAGSWVN